jgi:hypothetical protein
MSISGHIIIKRCNQASVNHAHQLRACGRSPFFCGILTSDLCCTSHNQNRSKSSEPVTVTKRPNMCEKPVQTRWLLQQQLSPADSFEEVMPTERANLSWQGTGSNHIKSRFTAYGFASVASMCSSGIVSDEPMHADQRLWRLQSFRGTRLLLHGALSGRRLYICRQKGSLLFSAWKLAPVTIKASPFIEVITCRPEGSGRWHRKAGRTKEMTYLKQS